MHKHSVAGNVNSADDGQQADDCRPDVKNIIYIIASVIL